MAKFYGKIGFVMEEVETRPSIYETVIEEKYYAGDLFQFNSRNQSADRPVDNFAITNTISIVMDPFAMSHLASMKYVEFMGSLWEVQSATIEHPRIRISIGGLYHGPTPKT